MRADDDGFLNNTKRIQRLIGATDDDLKLLIMKRFVIPFEDGIVVIKHWRMNNYLRKDRYTQTIYQEELAMLSVKEDGSYTLAETSGIPDGNQCVTVGIPDGNQLATQVSIGKDRIGKVSIESSINTACPEPEPAPDREQVISLTLNDRSEFWIYGDQVEQWSQLFPAVDVLQELRKMKSWLDSNPSRRKTKRGILRFVNSRLSREQDKGKLNYRTKAPQISEVDSW